MDRIAVLVPCYNEELTIGTVIDDFKKELPGANIYVYDNNSTDNTINIALEHKAIVVRAPIQGKGAVVQQMFKEVEADIYLIVDGDCTYPAIYAKELISKLSEFDMVIGDRLSGTYYTNNKRVFHSFGNKLVKNLVNILYHNKIPDIMTGYRAFRRDFVKNINLKSKGFTIETEMTILALKHNYKIGSVVIDYKDRPNGSISKLHTIKDGIKVLFMIIRLLFKK